MANAWGASWGKAWGVSWGSAPEPVVTSFGGHYGEFWRKQYLRMWEYKTPSKKKIVEAVIESPAEAVEAIPEVKKAFVERFGSVEPRLIAENLQMQQFLAQQILIAIQSRAIQLDEEDAEFLLLM